MNLELNGPQLEAVMHRDGPLLVLAGAGSGKTRVITGRIAQLIRGGAPADAVMAVTFTNKAAREMHERAAAVLASSTRVSWIGTFHALCARLLRRYGSGVGLQPQFVIYDTADQRALVDRVLTDLGVPLRMFSAADVLSHIDRAKNDGIGPREYAPNDFFTDVVAKVYPEYERRLLQANAVDFGNLLVKMVELLRNEQELAKTLSERFAYLLVDEFQDTNHVQYELVRLLTREHHNLCVVGDDDQSIYSWRGADISNILEFERDHPGARVVRLEQNYRSTQTVLDAAAAVIASNPGRKAKRLWTDRGRGAPIVVARRGDDREEARFIVETIARLRRERGRGYGEFAVFYRTHAQSRVIEEAMRGARPSIPHVVVGGVRFYDRAEVKDLIAYLRLIANEADDVALLRIVNEPPRGIGRTTLDKIAAHAKQATMSLERVLSATAEGKGAAGVGAGARTKLASFVELLRDLREQAARIGLAALAELVLERTGYVERLAAADSAEARARIENLAELVNSIRAYERSDEAPSLSGFLEQVALASDVDGYVEDEGTVTLMTVHSAKGLEYPVVLIAGLEQGIFPHARSLNDANQLAEERRLAYVAITRARERLFLTHAARRYVYGQEQVSQPSAFLADLPREILQLEPARVETPTRHGPRAMPPSRPRDEVWVDYDDDFAQTEQGRVAERGDFYIGLRVRHARFGEGEVRVITGVAPDLNLTIAFAGGLRTIRSRFVQPVSDTRT